MAESRTSNSSLNQDHNRTAQFNVLPTADASNGAEIGAMNGSKHSFYGTQQTGATNK